ncbi:hypothetical protein [Hymenobacter jejuensis]|uniref:Glycosyltransferase family 39 protein n=1 Tax=Hymenobacter jejuensis TaxID=2502781 RepID=A0A5B8A4I6_9BACT|nr:hypothetical protein [Hymenobacter jejuensis]QDA62258.1 hypothetical protein FHG12_20100 [Hymenobacter jejuensis]
MLASANAATGSRALLWKLGRVVALPALLMLLSGWALGCFYETNDDAVITLLLRGNMSVAPVTNLHLYFHGVAWILATLYEAFPAWPWYGFALYGLLYLSTVLAFAVLDRLLHPRFSGPTIMVLMVLFFCVAWVEHGMWFNYVRVPMLLGGAGLLYAAQRRGQAGALMMGLLAFGLAWLIRPSAAMLALIATAPGIFWLGGRRASVLVLVANTLAVVGGGTLTLTRSTAASNYRTLDVLKSNLNDYHLYRPTPVTAPDSLAMQAVEQWMLGDSAVVNPDLFKRASRFEAGYFLRHQFWLKATETVQQLLRDYFPLLLLQVLICWQVFGSQRYTYERRFWVVQVMMIGLLLALGIVLKLPPRLALPLLDLWVLGNLAYLLDARHPRPRLAPLSAGLLALVVLAYGYKTWHRKAVLSQEALRGQHILARFAAGLTGHEAAVVVAGLEEAFKSQSPFREFSVSAPKLVLLTGWPTLDPSQPALRQQLTGTRDFPTAMRALAQRSDVKWFLAPDAAALLSRFCVLKCSGNPPQVRWLPLQSGLGPAPVFYAPHVETVK